MASVPSGKNINKIIKKMERVMKNDKMMHNIIRILKPEYNATQCAAVILAFREAYTYSYFEDLNEELIE